MKSTHRYDVVHGRWQISSGEKVSAVVVGKFLSCALDLIEGIIKRNTLVRKILDIVHNFLDNSRVCEGRARHVESEESWGE